jgi:superfamily I DNA and/or RNA helicase
MNFGLINMRGGEKRLNVAFSRAKHHMAVVGSIHHGEITNDYNEGATCFKHYHRYAEAVSLPGA